MYSKASGLIVFAILALGLAACGSSSDQPSSTGVEKTVTPQRQIEVTDLPRAASVPVPRQEDRTSTKQEHPLTETTRGEQPKASSPHVARPKRPSKHSQAKQHPPTTVQPQPTTSSKDVKKTSGGAVEEAPASDPGHPSDRDLAADPGSSTQSITPSGPSDAEEAAAR
jgi:hypothetical protein